MGLPPEQQKAECVSDENRVVSCASFASAARTRVWNAMVRRRAHCLYGMRFLSSSSMVRALAVRATPPRLNDRILVVRPQWLSLILARAKTLEVRGRGRQWITVGATGVGAAGGQGPGETVD